MKAFSAFLFVIILSISGCSQSSQVESDITPTIEFKDTEVFPEETSTPTLIPSPTNTLISEPEITPSPTPSSVLISSPLQDYSIDELVDMISNLYNPPKPGSDDPHQGVDFSVVDPSLGYAIKGPAVQAILSGNVVMVTNDRFPYGNSLLIETTYENLPNSWKDFMVELPSPELFTSNPALTCPDGWDQPQANDDALSLFILYAHLANTVEWEVGDQIKSGDIVGLIGDSGNALAPHIHIEMRYGFSDRLMGNMAHYDVTANEEEMSNYCRWRVSGWYRLVDPMALLLRDP
jgi:murein DD-endopeptidase MepM/ murein hydrolase activator NlpD